eukprot:scaffold271_cov17-Tisochrysis_lutea.AAC.1
MASTDGPAGSHHGTSTMVLQHPTLENFTNLRMQVFLEQSLNAGKFQANPGSSFSFRAPEFAPDGNCPDEVQCLKRCPVSEPMRPDPHKYSPPTFLQQENDKEVYSLFIIN